MTIILFDKPKKISNSHFCFNGIRIDSGNEIEKKKQLSKIII